MMATFRGREPGLRYLAVANSLRGQIQQGTYQPGERLPGQHEMAKAYGVSFSTLKTALDLLEEEGYVVRKAGEGTYVALPEEHAPLALVVDDDRGFRGFLKEALTASGWRSADAESGPVALELLGEQPFDLVFLDLVMPGMNGVETFREIRKVAPALEVVIITDYPDSSSMFEALQVGPFAMIWRLFTLDELRLVLSRAQLAFGASRRGARRRRVQ